MTDRLAAVVLAKDVANHIAPCLETLHFTDQVVVISDPGPDDGTKALARAAGAQVIERAFDNFAGQRNAALDTVDAEWVFFVDADERATAELAAEVCDVIAASGEPVGWWVPRHNVIAGQRVRYGGFSPDYQLRLLRHGRARYDPDRPVHEVVLLDGPSAYLKNVLIHYNYDTWAQFHAKQQRYARFEGRMLRERGVRPWPHKFITVPFREWRRRYLALQGYRDGWLGLKLACLLAYYYGLSPHLSLLGRKDQN